MNKTQLSEFDLIYSGKNKDLYKVDNDHFLVHYTDKISVFDKMLSDLIPGRGAMLAFATRFWCDKTKLIIPNHISRALISLKDIISPSDELFNSCEIVRRYKPIKVEFIVRGYLYGHAWKEYCESGSLHGEPMQEGMIKAEKLAYPMFTPTSKSPIGTHDFPLLKIECQELLGSDLTNQIEFISLQLYEFAHWFLLERGVILADTKFEFALDKEGDLILIDEVITSDSSRIWKSDTYILGQNQMSYDKDIVREYVNSYITAYPEYENRISEIKLPQEVIDLTLKNYNHYINLLTKEI